MSPWAFGSFFRLSPNLYLRLRPRTEAALSGSHSKSHTQIRSFRCDVSGVKESISNAWKSSLLRLPTAVIYFVELVTRQPSACTIEHDRDFARCCHPDG